MKKVIRIKLTVVVVFVTIWMLTTYIAIGWAYRYGLYEGYMLGKQRCDEDIINCVLDYISFKESSNRHDNIWGDKSYKHPAYGKFQFQERTFNWLKNKAGFDHLEWKNEQHQSILAEWAIRNGYGYLWGDNFVKAFTERGCHVAGNIGTNNGYDTIYWYSNIFGM